jgi:PP-loop superfamily ATP-utilizing enzyme
MDTIAKELIELGFKYVTLDLEGYRSGSMLLTLETPQKPRRRLPEIS